MSRIFDESTLVPLPGHCPNSHTSKNRRLSDCMAAKGLEESICPKTNTIKNYPYSVISGVHILFPQYQVGARNDKSIY